VSSWYDIDPAETARMYATLRDRKDGDGRPIETGAIFGPWDHVNNGSGLGEWFFGLSSNSEVAGMPALFFDFFDRHLKGDAAKPPLGARYFAMGANQWRSAPQWPPAHRAQSFHLHSAGAANGSGGDGRLSAAPPPDGMAADRYSYDPLDPVPSIGGRYFEAGGSRPGPFNQQRVEARKDVLVYSSAPLAADVEIAGGVRLRVFVRCSTPDTDLTAKLCDVFPDGTSYNLVDEFFRCRWRDGYDKTVLFEPGKTYEFDIDLGPVAHVFKTGHRLRLQLTSSAFPHFDRNMNTGHAIGVDREGRIAEITVLHDARHPSALVLPVVQGDLPGG
jgi:putative CocE/NonD family hydrolase